MKYQPPEDLVRLARAELASMLMPESARGLYPALHAAAKRISTPDRYAEAVGAVFAVACEATGVTYGSQYMGNVLEARFKDGSLPGLLAGVSKGALA